VYAVEHNNEDSRERPQGKLVYEQENMDWSVGADTMMKNENHRGRGVTRSFVFSSSAFTP
jgi:hypothetical protein